MKNAFLIFLLTLSSYSFYGQTLVRYGNQTISRNEFLLAFRKNNSKVRATDSAYRNYLNLYIRYKLKVQEAYDERLDTLAELITELQNFKDQIVDQYLYDEGSLNQMTKEAFVRSQYDLRISCIFVAASKDSSPTEIAKAWKKINAAYRELKNHKDFNEVALKYSEDPFAKDNLGDLGYVTVFDLPYSIETVAYQTPLTKFSPVFRTDGGYIILKKTAKRHAEARIRIAQILLNIPDEAEEIERQKTLFRADSIYLALKKGADFDALSRKYSRNNLSYQLDGVLPESGIAKYEEVFAKASSNLNKDGNLSEYYESFMFHIVNRIARKPVSAVADKKTIDELKENIKSDPRIAVSRQHLLRTILKQTGFRQYIPSEKRLWDYTDSLLKDKKPASDAGITDQSVLFQFQDKKYNVGDWIAYRNSLKYFSSITNGKKNSEILDLFRQTVAFEYYKEHLEKYNPLFAAQVSEFRDGSLLFEIMQRRVWNRASVDSEGLKKYIEVNGKNLGRKPGAEAIVSTAAAMSPRTFDEARKLMITEYENELEIHWIEELKKKYPVTISENVLKTLPK